MSYLQMDGVNDYFLAPSITFTSIEMDFSAVQDISSSQYYLDARVGFGEGYVYRQTTGVDSWGTASISMVYINGIQVDRSTAFIPFDHRVTMRVAMTGLGTDDVAFFCRNNAPYANRTKGKIYSIKFYNGTTLVAHYDMAKRNVSDQTGNGNHGTLVGGTWVQTSVPFTANYRLRQVITRNTVQEASLRQEINSEREWNFPLRTIIEKSDKLIFVTIPMRGQRLLTVPIKGLRRLTVPMEGRVSMTIEQDLIMRQGESRVHPVTFKDQDGSILSLEGCTASFRAFQPYREAMELTKELVITDVINGAASFEFLPEDTISRKGTYEYVIWLTDSDGRKNPVTEGNLIIY